MAKQTSGQVSDRINEGLGLALAVIGAYFFMCLVTFHPEDPSANNSTMVAQVYNYGGTWGAYLADILVMQLGLAAYALPLLCFTYAVSLILHRPLQEWSLQVITIPILLLAVCALLQMVSPLPDWPSPNPLYKGFGNGGLLGKITVYWCAPNVGWVGCYILFLMLAFVSILWLTGTSLHDVYRGIMWVKRAGQFTLQLIWQRLKRIQFKKASQFDLPLQPRMPKGKPKVERPMLEVTKPATRSEQERQEALPLELTEGFALPPLRLLGDAPPQVSAESEDALTQNARRLEAELKNFGVEGAVTKICPGPVITIYELEPAAGVKTSSIVNLADDLARSMSAIAVRIAPIPGRNVIGIEMPNHNRQGVSLKELLDTADFESHAGKLTVAMGVDTAGNPVYEDIAKMPHALIAGTTGSGKSVAMNAFIMSLLYRLTPDQLKFVMVDPKMLELSIYNDIPHLLTPVITDPNKAASALNWVVKEMENRYRLMSELGVKNLASFNAKFSELQAAGEVPTRLVQTGFDVHTGQPIMEEQLLTDKMLPHIVVVIDELADLMMVAGKQVEMYIARLTQMARASGIHLLVATQRPSVDVVTGLIKANIPTRISFSVASKIDSRTVLDSMGAEQLLGKGDMLFLANGSNTIQRLHGAFVSEEECNAVAKHLREQSKPQYVEDIFKAAGAASGANGGTVTASEGGEGDELYQQAIEVIAKEQKASTSFLQRSLKIGYNRAADIIDRMESDGFISAANHVGKREVILRKPPEEGY
ncbi:MAG: DNA translocase FtsK 4TM domain-containing protein [Alphaproteobacteria bacterium]|nr:DNA translocase FtsK 4TM domain-containing protein [Alphaproteobacteria bacterium]MDD9919591.1 DNA translocase FtsK 4TM domain-containing protein [Alphaproteobacteria bacterium]